MPLKDLLKKRDKIHDDAPPPVAPAPLESPEFTFMRTDTHTQELISPPTFASDTQPHHAGTDDNHSHNHNPFSRLRRGSVASVTFTSSNKEGQRPSSKDGKRLSRSLHFRSGSRASSQASVNVPSDLPEIKDVATHNEDSQAQWEQRAAILANANAHTRERALSHSDQSGRSPPRQGHRKSRSDMSIPSSGLVQIEQPAHLGAKPMVKRSISDAKGDENIQEAIRLHEAGELSQSTAMFGRLADSNAMAQIMYGLALRHGWGITPNPTLGIAYLSQAASNSASVESDALNAGMKKGGAAKGELVLAMYELANSFRHGWGVEKDPMAARKYYECAANLGDTDAMNEVARCYEEGLGGKKDKVRLDSSMSRCHSGPRGRFPKRPVKAQLHRTFGPWLPQFAITSTKLRSHQRLRSLSEKPETFARFLRIATSYPILPHHLVT